jgi:hypothetical protein
MNASGTSPIDLTELTRLLKAVEPAALLLPTRLVRRVIKYDRQVGGVGLLVPHRRSYVIGRDRLLNLVDREELEVAPEVELPPTLLLLARPSPATCASTPPGTLLLKYWRTLFHARIHVALDRRWAEGHLTAAGLRERLGRIGTTEGEEIRSVLEQEKFLLPPRDDREIYGEFAALYLELRYFDASLLNHYFPGIKRFDQIDALLATDLDADRLFAATRLEGAPDPVPPQEPLTDEAEPPLQAKETFDAEQPEYRLFKRLNKRAKKASELGNVVRAAIAKTQAVAIAPPKRKEEMRTGARAELERLATRLQAAVGLDTQEAVQWRKALNPLLRTAARGVWPVEARLLYDLQQVCIDHERELYAVDLVEWALSLFRRPLQRPVPCQRQVLLLKHLRTAGRRLKAARLTDPDRQRLNQLFYGAVRHCEERLRQSFRPVIQETLTETGMRPRNLPEGVALNKLIEELLDRIVDHGFVVMGDLRDALSRNNLKLPDLAGPEEFVRGDRLIRADRRFARILDGVYRGGEIYLRGLQRLSSLAFGTRVGRFLTLYAILPFGGAFVVLEGLQHLLGYVVPAGPKVPEAELPVQPAGDNGSPDVPDIVRASEAQAAHEAAIHLVTPVSLVLLGLFLLALLHLPAFRRTVWQGVQWLYRAVRGLLIDWPWFLLHLPAVRAVLDSRPFVWFKRWVLKPLVVAGLAGMVLWWSGADPDTTYLLSGAVFLATSALLNTRLGRDLEEAITDGLISTWERFHIDLLPGVFRLVMGVFRRVLETIDRVIYRVDEWLRFRQGDSRLALMGKPVLGLFWFLIAYLVRIYVNLLIEPTVNPIKHFPVVTVAAKLILVFVNKIATLTAALLAPLGKVIANSIAWVNVVFIPGVFGFLVWEFKENWRLYEANRSASLSPVMIGHHGETLVRLLRPGLHSGTIPKLYAKLRQAERTAHRGGAWKPARKYREALYQVKKSIHHFVDRELGFLLNRSSRWQPLHLAAGKIELGTNCVRIELECRGLTPPHLELVFEMHAGLLVAGISEPGWLGQLARLQCQALLTALAGLYKLAGVDLVREQIETVLGVDARSYRIEEGRLRVRADVDREVVYDLREGQVIQPQTPEGAACKDRPVLSADQLLFKRVPVTWPEWVQNWEAEPEGADFGRLATSLGRPGSHAS